MGTRARRLVEECAARRGRSERETNAADVDEAILLDVLAAHRRLGATNFECVLACIMKGSKINVPGGAENDAEDRQRRAGQARDDIDRDREEATSRRVVEGGAVIAAVGVAAVAAVVVIGAGLEVDDGRRDGERGEEGNFGDEREAHGG